MKNTIRLYWTSQGWMAEYAGPHAAEIVRLFGTNTLPTAFTSAASAECVYSGIKAKNPDCEVSI